MNNLLIIPSIDIKGGNTVRVVQGIPELECKQYGNDPIAMAMIYRAENAKCLHIVDFDAAHTHSRKNFEIIREICEAVIIPVQYGGGIHTLKDAELALSLGAYRLIIGSMIHDSREEFVKTFEKFGPQKIVAAIDVMDNEVVVHGRADKTGINVFDYARELAEIGIGRFAITDINRNGMMSGPNIELSLKIAEITEAKVTLMGGIGGYKDLISIAEQSEHGIDSAIIGRAIYENKFPCQNIWRLAESGLFN